MFELINNLAGRSAILDAIGIFCAVWLIWLLVVYYLLSIHRQNIISRYWHILMIVFIIGLIYTISFIVGYVWFEPRPFASQGVNLLINAPVSDKSFPSDHAAIAMALAVACWQAKIKWWQWSFVVAALVAVGRVYVGVHFFQDVVAGILLGWGLAWFIYKLFDRYFTKLRRAVL